MGVNEFMLDSYLWFGACKEHKNKWYPEHEIVEKLNDEFKFDGDAKLNKGNLFRYLNNDKVMGSYFDDEKRINPRRVYHDNAKMKGEIKDKDGNIIAKQGRVRYLYYSSTTKSIPKRGANKKEWNDILSKQTTITEDIEARKERRIDDKRRIEKEGIMKAIKALTQSKKAETNLASNNCNYCNESNVDDTNGNDGNDENNTDNNNNNNNNDDSINDDDNNDDSNDDGIEGSVGNTKRRLPTNDDNNDSDRPAAKKGTNKNHRTPPGINDEKKKRGYDKLPPPRALGFDTDTGTINVDNGDSVVKTVNTTKPKVGRSSFVDNISNHLKQSTQKKGYHELSLKYQKETLRQKMVEMMIFVDPTLDPKTIRQAPHNALLLDKALAAMDDLKALMTKTLKVKPEKERQNNNERIMAEATALAQAEEEQEEKAATEEQDK